MENFRSELRHVKNFNTDYYRHLLAAIDNHVEEKPDISIETCKAVIEGLSKFILQELNQTPDTYFQNNDLTLSKLFKEARTCLNEKIAQDRAPIVYEDKIVDEYGGLANIVERLMPTEAIARVGSIRNDHGDISHGRTPLKQQVNDQDVADLIINIIDSIATYMLRKLNQLKQSVIYYEDHPEFNAELDDLNPLSGKVLYSRALYDQERETYQEELEDYYLRKEEENA